MHIQNYFNMKTTFITAFAFLLFAGAVLGQTKPTNPWSEAAEAALAGKAAQRQIVPQTYRTQRLDVASLQSILGEAPLWFTEQAAKKQVVLTLPMPDGSFQDFSIVEAPVMHPDLAKRYPMIKSYAGTGLDDPTAYLRFDFTQRGFHAMILTAETSTVFIDPYSTADVEHYVVYYKKDFTKDTAFECHFDEVNPEKKKPSLPAFEKVGDCQLRTYVLALACTGEYATFHGGTVPLVLAAMNTSMTRVNGVYEKDASIHMDLHPNTDDLIFLNASTDPYSNGNGSAMLGQNQTTCDNVIGNANYDIGHVFSTGGGGVAYLGAVCSNSIKAGGVTGQPNPVGDPFDIDYVAHEMGHQFGANHTQNNNCNRNSSTAMEPGSASTIMGYAGICSPNVQNNSDDFFHAISLQEIAAEVTAGGSGGGNTCSSNSTVNSAPVVTPGSDYTIPVSTPFVLTGVATDPEGDPMTYTWEQMNNQVATMPPVSTSTTGPAFRSYKGTTSPSRYLPRLQDLVNNVSPTWEVLASVSRTYNWRLTVRDNHPGGGCTDEDDIVVTVSNTSGPFVVTAPNTAVNWPALSTQTVTWNVANTTAAPVSCANVDIFLSLDGGFTYPVTLATAVPNDGSHDVFIPNNQTTQARVMVKGAGNIFFDISNQNFTISAPLDGFTLEVDPAALAVCAPANAVFSVDVTATGTFNGNVTLSVSGQPAGSVAVFSPNPVTAPGTSQLTISNLAAAPAGVYDLTVTGAGSTGQQSEMATLAVANGLPAVPLLTAPANGATGVSPTPTLTWNAIPAATYDLEVAADAAFTNIILDETGLSASSYDVVAPLNPGTQYFWRVKAANTCGAGLFSAANDFTTANIVCTTFVSTDVPKSISSSGTPTVTSTLPIAALGSIGDVNVLDLDIDHTYIDDLIVKLKSPENTEITLLNRICGSQNNILLDLDDEATNTYNSIPCPPNGGTYRPFQALSAFDGEEINGTWTLTINDVANQDGGTLQSWSLEICYAAAAPLTVATSVTDATCNGAANGSATANPAGATGSYAYEWSNGATTQTANGLAAGSYTVTVTSGAATATASVTVLEPEAIVVAAPALTQPTCADTLGAITFNATGPADMEYSIDNGVNWQMSNVFTDLPAGDYYLLVRLSSDPDCETAYAANPVTLDAVAGCCPLVLAVNFDPIPNGPYDAELDITSTGRVPAGGDVQFRAGNSVELLPEFEVVLGGVFEILMQGCGQ